MSVVGVLAVFLVVALEEVFGVGAQAVKGIDMVLAGRDMLADIVGKLVVVFDGFGLVF